LLVHTLIDLILVRAKEMSRGACIPRQAEVMRQARCGWQDL